MSIKLKEIWFSFKDYFAQISIFTVFILVRFPSQPRRKGKARSWAFRLALVFEKVPNEKIASSGFGIRN
jgi:hypothetical protein